MSITKAQKARLGIFMTSGVILLLFFLTIPLAFKLTKKTVDYYSFFEGESLSGLSVGADVKYHGVMIGKVSDINYQLDDLTKVKVIYSIRDDFPMKNDMKATAGLMGITGLLYIEIMGGSNEAASLPEGSEIPSKASLMSAITGKAEGIVNKVEMIINNLNALTNPDSLKSIKVILDNVAGISQTAKDFSDHMAPDVEMITKRAKITMENVDSIAQNINNITRNFDQKVDLEHVGDVIGRIDSMTKALSDMSIGINLTVQQSREDISIIMENFVEASENSNELMRMLMENPSLILKGDQQKERKIHE